MDEKVAIEIVLGLLVGIPLLLIGWIVLRRMVISRNSLMILMAVRRGDSWVMGMARHDDCDVQWFPVLGVGLRPKSTVARHELEVGPPEPAPADAPSVITDPVAVTCRTPQETVEVVVGRQEYAQMRSWSESAPPGRNMRLFE